MEYTRFFSEPEPTQIEGNNPPNCAYRPAYWLNWTGPVVTVNTTCSSSLVACHLALQSLDRSECSTAIVGGIQCDLFPYWTEEQQLGMKSDNHCCKTFDANADGVAFGEGIAAIILKPLEEALQDKDPIHAIIRGSSVNSDGRSNGMTAPNPLSQEKLIQQAIKQSGVGLNEIGYFEAHGTGTKIGDPIEVKALHKVMHAAKQSSYLGSVKPNIGHLGDTAGLAGLIKAVLAIKYRQIPQQLHLEKVSLLLNHAEKCFHIPMKNEPWDLKGGLLS